MLDISFEVVDTWEWWLDELRDSFSSLILLVSILIILGSGTRTSLSASIATPLSYDLLLRFSSSINLIVEGGY